jgi:Ion channel
VPFVIAAADREFYSEDEMDQHVTNDRIALFRERWSDPLLTALTLLVVVMLFVIAPLQASGLFVFQAFELAFALVLVAGVFVISGSRVAVFAMLASLLIATAGGVHRIMAPSGIDINLFATSWLIMTITLGWAVASMVFSPGRVTYHHVMGAVLLYLIIAVSFVPLFAFVGSLVPKAFSGIAMQDDPTLASNLIYFSFVTLTTTGYGDVFPVHPIARSLCNLEAVIGQLYPATLLARLVTLEMAHRS